MPKHLAVGVGLVLQEARQGQHQKQTQGPSPASLLSLAQDDRARGKSRREADQCV